MNYKITISNGKNEIERYYEQGSLTDNAYIADQVKDMVETLNADYPKNWDSKISEQDQLNAEYFAEQEENNGMERAEIYN